METMEAEFHSVFQNVSPRVVLVEQVRRIDYYCIGSITFRDDQNIFILTQSKIVDSSADLSIRFSSGFKQPATLLLRRDQFCILVTNYYNNCKTVEFFEGSVNHSHAVAIAPASRSSVYNIPGFVVHKSLEAGSLNDESVIEGSEDYFTFSCQYGERSPNLVSRLISGPVFNLDGQVLGIVADDMGYDNHPKGEDNKRIHEDCYFYLGFFLKVVICASSLHKMLKLMTGEDDWQNSLKQRGRQRGQQQE